MVTVGRKVPRLKGVLHDGGTLALTDLRGSHVVIYFYPKDDTPGCTSEALAFAALYPRFRERDCGIVGVSRDPVKRHAKFHQKHALPFPLVADEDGSWCEAFGVIGEKTLYGRRFLGIIRSTFLIGADGTLAAEWRGVRVPGHAEAVLERLDRT
jgi:peroxiredoxin Q/BCP